MVMAGTLQVKRTEGLRLRYTSFGEGSVTTKWKQLRLEYIEYAKKVEGLQSVYPAVLIGPVHHQARSSLEKGETHVHKKSPECSDISPSSVLNHDYELHLEAVLEPELKVLAAVDSIPDVVPFSSDQQETKDVADVQELDVLPPPADLPGRELHTGSSPKPPVPSLSGLSSFFNHYCSISIDLSSNVHTPGIPTFDDCQPVLSVAPANIPVSNNQLQRPPTNCAKKHWQFLRAALRISRQVKLVFVPSEGLEIELLGLATEKAFEVIFPWCESASGRLQGAQIISDRMMVYVRAIDLSVSAAQDVFTIAEDALFLAEMITKKTPEEKVQEYLRGMLKTASIGRKGRWICSRVFDRQLCSSLKQNFTIESRRQLQQVFKV
ncbi:hypothetical protein B0H34DRAFT_68113 [Crassisporium funariophilum]|nr:hypothetical protein B0H34DRAFT_68113 [Crassisporium funariophilum]